MRIAILDDEKVYANRMKQLILKEYPDCIVTVFLNKSQLLSSKDAYDLLLLDIQMPDIDGIKFAKTYKGRFQHIIYVTSFQERVYSAFDSNVYGFIIKSDMDQLLIPVITKFMNRQKRTMNIPIDMINIEFELCDLLCYTIDGKCVDLKTISQTYHLDKRAILEQLDQCLNAGFVRVNRQCVVNLTHVVRVNHIEKKITLSDDTVIQVSRRSWNNFLEAYNRREL